MTMELRADLCQLVNFENELTSADAQLITETIVSGFKEIDEEGRLCAIIIICIFPQDFGPSPLVIV